MKARAPLFRAWARTPFLSIPKYHHHEAQPPEQDSKATLKFPLPAGVMSRGRALFELMARPMARGLTLTYHHQALASAPALAIMMHE